MPFTDLDEQLKKLGFGQQWQQQSRSLAELYVQGKVGGNDISRLVQYNKRNKQRHRMQKNQWRKKRYMENKHRIGQKCIRCAKPMDANDVIGDAKLPNRCTKCRKFLTGESNE